MIIINDPINIIFFILIGTTIIQALISFNELIWYWIYVKKFNMPDYEHRFCKVCFEHFKEPPEKLII